MAWAKNSSGAPSASFPALVRHCIFIVILGLYSFFGVPAHATSWADPGDTLLRHDLQLLADNGLLQVPLTTWPVSWWDIRQNMDNIAQRPPQAHPGTAVQQALARIRQRLATLPGLERTAWQTKLTAATDLPGRMSKCGECRDAQEPPVMPFRTFAATPRAPGEIEASVTGGSQHTAYRVQAQAVAEPEDGQNLRLDGSYATLLLGNWGVTLG